MIYTKGYTGHEHIQESNLINMNARLYDPSLGRFLSADTLIPNPYETQDFNRYAYVRNNPLKYTDPSGHCSVRTAKEHEIRDNWRYDSVFRCVQPTSGLDRLITYNKYLLPWSDGNYYSWSNRMVEVSNVPINSSNLQDHINPYQTDVSQSNVAGDKTNFLSLSGNITVGLGLEFSLGVYWNNNTGEIGYHGSIGLTVGIDAGVGINYGETTSPNAFDGIFYSHSLGVSKGGVTEVKTENGQTRTGWSVGFNQGPVRVGWHQTYGTGTHIRAKSKSHPELNFEGP